MAKMPPLPKCPVCGKRFYIPLPEVWAYRWNYTPLCSWTCLRTYEARAKQKKQEARIAKPPAGRVRVRRSTVRWLRQQMGLSQEGLSVKCGRGKSWVQRVESGEAVTLSVEEVEILAEALECDPQLLKEG